MKTIKTVAVAGLISAGSVFAADLWDFGTAMLADEPFLAQVKTPGAKACWAITANLPTAANNYKSPCYSGTGGWWFGYGDEGGKVYDGMATTFDLTANEAIKMNEYSEDAKAQVFIKGRGLAGATKGLEVIFDLTGGTDEKPSVAGVGFNWRNKDGADVDGKTVENISGQSGLCMSYEASAAGIGVELGWNEATNGYNTWVVALPAGNNTVNLLWSQFEQSYTGETATKDYALQNAEALKIAYKNKTASAMKINFTLKKLGWNGTCGTEVSIKGGSMAAGPQFNLAGRMLSMVNVSAPTQVQIINMHGSVVAQKSLGQNEQLNLANMPNGVYLVRSAKLGISQKIILK